MLKWSAILLIFGLAACTTGGGGKSSAPLVHEKIGNAEATYDLLKPYAYKNEPVAVDGALTSSCANIFVEAMHQEGVQAKSIPTHIGRDFICEWVFQGTGKEFDERLDSIEKVESKTSTKLLKFASEITSFAVDITSPVTFDLGMPNKHRAELIKTAARTGRNFGESEPAIIVRLAGEGFRGSTFVTAVLHKDIQSSQDLTEDDRAALKKALYQGLIHAANVTGAK